MNAENNIDVIMVTFDQIEDAVKSIGIVKKSETVIRLYPLEDGLEIHVKIDGGEK